MHERSSKTWFSRMSQFMISSQFRHGIFDLRIGWFFVSLLHDNGWLVTFQYWKKQNRAKSLCPFKDPFNLLPWLCRPMDASSRSAAEEAWSAVLVCCLVSVFLVPFLVVKNWGRRKAEHWQLRCELKNQGRFSALECSFFCCWKDASKKKTSWSQSGGCFLLKPPFLVPKTSI